MSSRTLAKHLVAHLSAISAHISAPESSYSEIGDVPQCGADHGIDLEDDRAELTGISADESNGGVLDRRLATPTP